MDTRGRVDQAVNALRGAGCRITPQRLAIIQVVLTDAGHPTADQVFRQVKRSFPTTSLATIYKTLDLMETLGLLLEIDTPAGARFDGYRAGTHAHLICDRCERVVDLEASELIGLAERLSRQTGHQVDQDEMVFRGVCRMCLDSDRKEAVG